MRKIYLYKCKDNKELKKVINIFNDLFILYSNLFNDNFISFELDKKLTRKLKINNIDKRNSLRGKKHQKLVNIIRKSIIFNSQDELNKFRKSNKKYISETNYLTMPKYPKKDNQKFNKQTSNRVQHGPSKLFCTKCRFSYKQHKLTYKLNRHRKGGFYAHVDEDKFCPKCGSKKENLVHLSSWVRVPKKIAKKRTWKIFFKKFIKNV